jgi:hypothetical protein
MNWGPQSEGTALGSPWCFQTSQKNHRAAPSALIVVWVGIQCTCLLTLLTMFMIASYPWESVLQLHSIAQIAHLDIDTDVSWHLRPPVRGHPSVSLPLLSSPLLLSPSTPLVYMYTPYTSVPSPGTPPKADDLCIQSLTTFRSFFHLYLSSIGQASDALGQVRCHTQLRIWLCNIE